MLEDSSGNGGAAVAAYAAAGGHAGDDHGAGHHQPGQDGADARAGAAVELIPGTRQDDADAAMRGSETIFYASHNWHPFFLQGTKTLAYELWEDLGFAAPDNVIIPCGAGSNVLGCEIGFSELLRAGQIDRSCRASSPPSRRIAARSPRAFLAGQGHRSDAGAADHRRGHRHCPADPAAGSARRRCAEPGRGGAC